MPRRCEQLQIRVTAAEKAAIRAAANRAGVTMSEWILARALSEPATRLASLARVAESATSHAAWAEIIELLQELSSLEFDAAVRSLDVAGLSPHSANYLAALVEMSSHRLGRPPPSWTRDVAALETPWFGTDLRRLRDYLLVHAPVAFRRRNIFADSAVGDRV